MRARTTDRDGGHGARGFERGASRQPATAEVEIVERWIARVAGARENLDAITDWSSAEVYSGNALDPGEALRRLFPDVLRTATSIMSWRVWRRS